MVYVTKGMYPDNYIKSYEHKLLKYFTEPLKVLFNKR